MFIKRSEYSNNIFPLNVPVLPLILKDQHLLIDSESVSSTIRSIKTAAAQSKDGDNTVFDLEAEIKEHPDSLFVKCFAIEADVPNDNGDYFSKEELKKAYQTFVGVPVFTNHQNTDINQARGKVVHSWWDEERNGISVIKRIDAVAYPQLARGIKEKYVLSTSMGCQVAHSICSICHNSAVNQQEYCSCIRETKTRKISKKNVECKYHLHGTEDKCPICGSTKKEAKKFDVNDQKVFEYNYGVKFIESSFVVNPAFPNCGVTEIIDPQAFLSKVSDIQKRLPALMKAAHETPLACTDQSCIRLFDDQHMTTLNNALGVLAQGADYVLKMSSMELMKEGTQRLLKHAGEKELGELNSALDLLTSVSQSMLKQKDQLDLEFLSDLIKVLADLQTVTDELNEQGYGRLQSPDQSGGTMDPSQSTPTGKPSPAPAGNAAPPPPPQPGKVESGPAAGGVGTVTGPAASSKLNLSKIGESIVDAKARTKQLNPKLSLEKQKVKKFAGFGKILP